MIRMAEKMKQARFDLHPCLLEIEGGDADAVAAVEGEGVRGATITNPLKNTVARVSIRAPRERGDLVAPGHVAPVNGFNPRPP